MSDYKKRFVKEFKQLQSRIGKLDRMIRKAKLGKLDFTPDCPLELLESQLHHMMQYMECLKNRAICEDIDLKY